MTFTVAPDACGSSTTMPRAMTCGSAKTSESVLIGPQPIFSASSAATQSAVVRDRMIGVRAAVVASRLRTRSALVAKRGSASSSSQPNALQNRAKVGSLPTARMM